MAQVGETEVVAGNVRDIVNRLSRDMTNRNPFTVHQQMDKKAPISQIPTVQLFEATYSYSSKQEDELSFNVGDVIELISEVEDGWSKGRLKSNGQIGMFPTNFVAPKAITPVSSCSTASTSRPKVNDVVMRTEPKIVERTPSTIVSDPIVKVTDITKFGTLSATPASVSTDNPTETAKMKEMARIKFVYNPNHDDELALKDLDALVNVTNKNCGDAGWYEGELNGKKGLFPDNFVELVQVPFGTESGTKYSSVSRQNALNLGAAHKPPPVNPPQPAVPPKPAKIASVDTNPLLSSISAAPAASSQVTTASTHTAPSSSTMPSITSSSKPLNANFAALREKMSNNLKVVAPEKVSSVQIKQPEQRERASTAESTGESPAEAHGSGDQITELQHITKSRARPPKSRPMSMVMNRNRSSDESPTGRLSSPTSAPTINPMSTSMFVPASAKETPFKPSAAPSSVVPPSSASKPALRPIASNSFAETSESSSSNRKLASPDALRPADPSTSTDYVSRVEYDALLDRFRALESRVISLEKLRF